MHLFDQHAQYQLRQSSNSDIRYWLTSSGSLTSLLEAKAGQPLRVERIFEGYRLMTLKQKKQFGFSGSQLNRPMQAWVRDSLLYGCDASPWVKAQSVFPLLYLKGEAKRLQHLQSTPIGYVLFKRQNSLPNQRTINQTDLGWQRQTLYDWYGRRLMVSETFLSAFLEC